MVSILENCGKSYRKDKRGYCAMFIDSIKDVPHVENKVLNAIKASFAPVVLFGAGDMACYVLTYLRQHEIEPVCICDNNFIKHGSLYLGLPVYSYDSLKDKFANNHGKYNIVVSVGPQYKAIIYSQLADAHEKNPVWYLQGYELCGEKIDYGYISEHLSQFEEAYTSLCDDFSKKVFINVLNAKISGDFALYREVMSGKEYFDDDVVKLANNEAFLDVGAYKGNAIFEFVKRTSAKYDAIIGFEPDKKTFGILRKAVAENGIQKVELYNKGAWDKPGFLHFFEGRGGSSRFLETTDLVSSANYVEVDTIDNILHGRCITYVSMDVEGAEHFAILGAEQTIRKWKPKIAVCVYHKREDLFDLLLLLKSFIPEYRFYLRHYTNNQTETVLYAV